LTLDIDGARERFEDSTDFTVGLEEEFAILDPETLELAHRYEDVKAACDEDEVLAESAAGELIASEVEIRSGRGETFGEAVAAQQERRERLFALVDSMGLALGAMGTHPWANYLDQRIIDTPHYSRLREELGYVAQRNNTWSLHVHVGVRGADRAIAVCDRLRELLPALLAASANSPFLDRHDSGLASVRSEIFTRTFPRCGVPSPFVDWDTYKKFVATLERTNSVVESIRKVAPQTKFVGLALAQPSSHPEQFEYFLNPKNHKPGIPLDFISYHFYAVPTGDQNPTIQPYMFFAYADGFLSTVRYVETIRKRLSPETKTTIDEIGAISADDVMQDQPGHVTQPIPSSYWNLTCAMYAYIFGELTRMGVDVAGESQLVGYPTQFPSVSMVDWNTGKPNSRIRVLRLLRENFGPGDKIVETEPFNRSADSYLYSLAVVKPDGKRRILLVNKRDRPFDITIPGGTGGIEEYVDQTTAFNPPASTNSRMPKIVGSR